MVTIIAATSEGGKCKHATDKGTKRPQHYNGVESPTMASTEARGDPVGGTAQCRGVGAGMMLSPQRETTGHTLGN